MSAHQSGQAINSISGCSHSSTANRAMGRTPIISEIVILKIIAVRLDPTSPPAPLTSTIFEKFSWCAATHTANRLLPVATTVTHFVLLQLFSHKAEQSVNPLDGTTLNYFATETAQWTNKYGDNVENMQGVSRFLCMQPLWNAACYF